MLDLETLAVAAAALAFADREDFDRYQERPARAALRGALQAVSREIVALDPGPPIFRLELGIGTDNRPQRGRTRGPSGERLKAWAPTLNEYNALLSWQKAKLKEAIDWLVAEASARYPNVLAMRIAAPAIVSARGKIISTTQFSPFARRRLAIVTRRSSRKPDEISCDSIGGKMPLDALVRAGILAGDSEKWLERRARWEPANTGEGRVVVEVFEIR